MRCTRSFLAVLLLILTASSLHAQTAAKPSILGAWTIEDVDAKAKLVFNKDGTFTRTVTTVGGTKTDKGKYKIVGNVILVEPEGEDEAIAVKFELLSPNKLKLMIPDEEAIVMDRAKTGVSVDDLPPMPLRTGGPLWPAKVGKKYGYVDKAGTFVVKPQYADAGYFHENRAAAKKDKWGYIDPTGKVVIEMKYDKAHPFSNGLACVELGSRCGYVNAEGKEVVPLTFVGEGRMFFEGKAAVRDGGKWGYIDRAGKWIIQPKYKGGRRFSGGLAPVMHEDDGKYRYINDKGETVIEAKFAYAYPFRGGRAAVRVSVHGDYHFIDAKGDVAIEAKYPIANEFSEGLASVKVDGKYGYIDRTGKMIITPRFRWARDFSGGLAAVVIGTKEGYIDRTGKVVIEAVYWQANSFQGDLARVKFSSDVDGLVNRKGELVFDGRKHPATRPASKPAVAK